MVDKPSIVVRVTPKTAPDFKEKDQLEQVMEQFNIGSRIAGIDATSVEVYGYTDVPVEVDRVRIAVQAVFPGATIELGTIQQVNEVDGIPVTGAVYE